MTTNPKIVIGAACLIPCAWMRDGTASARIVSFDQETACVAIEQEFLPNQKCHELLWVRLEDVSPTVL